MGNTTCTVFNAQPSEVRRQIDAWLSAYDGEITHFVTLTFDASRIDALIDRNSKYKRRNAPELVELYQRSMRHFLKRLQRKLYGNSAARGRSELLFIPILEGLKIGEVPHYHCFVRACSDRSERLKSAVETCWKSVPFAGQQTDIQTYRDRGCLIYGAKNAISLNRESVDWLNIQLPKTIGSPY